MLCQLTLLKVDELVELFVSALSPEPVAQMIMSESCKPLRSVSKHLELFDCIFSLYAGDCDSSGKCADFK